jgi:hypothetical protein
MQDKVNQQTASTVVFPGGVRVAISGQRYNDQGEAALADGGELGMCGYHATQAALRQEMKPMWSVV